MSQDKKAGQTQVAWALLTQGVAESRLEAHRLRHLLERALRLIGKSEAKEHLYEVAGDIIQVAPRRFDRLETVLDRTSYALSVLGNSHLRERLPMEDRALVDDATHKARPFISHQLQRSTSRVAYAYLTRQADLMPPLGYPGGICHVTNRIQEEVRNPKLRDELVDDVEQGKKLTNQDANQVYDLENERGIGKFKQLQITPHAQYRMDQRGIVVSEVRLALASFQKRWADFRSQKAPQARTWEMDMMRGEPILWSDPKLRLTIVFVVHGKDKARLVTTYWEGQPDPKPTGRTCPAPR